MCVLRDNKCTSDAFQPRSATFTVFVVLFGFTVGAVGQNDDGDNSCTSSACTVVPIVVASIVIGIFSYIARKYGCQMACSWMLDPCDFLRIRASKRKEKMQADTLQQLLLTQQPAAAYSGHPSISSHASLQSLASTHSMIQKVYGANQDPNKYFAPSNAAAAAVADLPKTHASLCITPFDAECTFPDVMLSYQTNSTGVSLGKSWMWALANELKKHGITTFNGYQVRGGEDWQLKWFGKLPKAKSVVVMLSRTFFTSRACVNELHQAVSQRKNIIPIFLDDVSVAPDVNFLGDDDEDIELANFLRTAVGTNRVPPPNEGVFQGEVGRKFQDNAARLAQLLTQIHEKEESRARQAQSVP
eukprot:m.249210 g.249210  ORF g.249210 m.249210 type:complete len:358 (+) comp19516_c1_seq5:279-1352(+)